MRSSRTLRQAALALVFALVAACGGSKDDTAPAAPTPSATYAASVPVTAVVTLDGGGSVAPSGNALTYLWTLTARPAGSAATIVNPTAAQASLTPDVVGAYAMTLTVDDRLKSQSVPFTVTATAYTPPTILSNIVEPLSGAVQLSLSTDPGTSTVTWTADGVALGTGATVTWDTTGVAAGSHVVVAQIQSTAKYVTTASQAFQVKQSTVGFASATFTESAGTFAVLVVPTSANGILRVAATLDGATLGSLAAPNACVDASGANCASTGANAYAFGGTVASGAHVAVVTATDGIGNSLGTRLRLTVTDVP